MFRKLFFQVIFPFVFCVPAVVAQHNISVKYFGLTIHPFGDKMAHLQKFRLDDKARFVLNFGGFVSYEKYVFEDFLSVKAVQGIFSDCSAGLAGATSIGIKSTFFQREKSRFSVYLGPVFVCRDHWNRFPEYTSSGVMSEFYHKKLGWVQYQFFPVAAEIEYDYRLNDNFDLCAGFTPGVPYALTFSFGARYWFNKNFKKGDLRLPAIK